MHLTTTLYETGSNPPSANYDIYEIGFFLGDGQLFALYVSPDKKIAEKVIGTDFILALDILLTGEAVNNIVVDGNYQLPDSVARDNLLYGENIIKIHTQQAFDKIFNRGKDTVIPQNTTIILSPIQDVFNPHDKGQIKHRDRVGSISGFEADTTEPLSKTICHCVNHNLLAGDRVEIKGDPHFAGRYRINAVTKDSFTITKGYQAQTADASWQGNVLIGVGSFSPVNSADPLSITRVKLTAHGFVVGSKIEIANSQYYSGSYAVASASNDAFDIDAPYHFGDISMGAWGGRGNEPQHTFNGRPAYILKNSILLGTNSSIIGFNPADTVIVKSGAEVKIKIKGNSSDSITGVRLCGWSFDGRGNIDNLGGTLKSSTNGGAFEIDYASRCELNCHIINHSTTAKGGALFGSASSNATGSTFGRCDYITAEHIRKNRADGGAGGAYGCNASKLRISDCYSNLGASGAESCYASMLLLDNCNAGNPTKNIIYKNNNQLSIEGPLRADSVDTGQGAFKINSIASFEGNQNLKTTDSPRFNTINTGQGAFKVNSIAQYAGDQNLKTTDTPEFKGVRVSQIVPSGSSVDVISGSISFRSNSTDKSGIQVLPDSFDSQGGGGRILFNESNNGKFGFSLGYNGRNSAYNGWPKDSFGISRHNWNETGEMALCIKRVTGNIGVKFDNPAAALCVNGGVNIGGQTDPGANNLEVAGRVKASSIQVGDSSRTGISAILAGAVDFDGSVLNGQGFTVDKKYTGTYAIRFKSPLATAYPVINITRWGKNETRYDVTPTHNASRLCDGFYFDNYNALDDLSDQIFCFTVMDVI